MSYSHHENPGDYARVHRRIKRLWDEGLFTIEPHAQRRMAKRHIDLLDVQNIILDGSIVSRDRKGDQWRYRIQGATVAGATASCIVAIEGRLISVLDY
ncbi:MAG: DUF4258 domain-containing protein [Candidatus Rokubacteria bacterium]|nr:DUF4258 domain-containing protein [Candidatus Rokubacteria bacterium]MBI2491366.1 DUF4258 domain-containing protein [Candidatus Rokubacteria bacterium]